MNSQMFRQFYGLSKLSDKNALLDISGLAVVMIIKTYFHPSNTARMRHGLKSEELLDEPRLNPTEGGRKRSTRTCPLDPSRCIRRISHHHG